MGHSARKWRRFFECGQCWATFEPVVERRFHPSGPQSAFRKFLRQTVTGLADAGFGDFRMRAKQLADGLCLVPHDKETHQRAHKWVSFDSLDDCKQSMQDELTPHLLRIRFHMQTELDPGWLWHRMRPCATNPRTSAMQTMNK
jgi:hypothetical protein